jgi:uncharacterized iron-regulated membrane protein
MKLDPRFLRKIHRWLALAFSVTLLMSASSGILHSVMSRTQPPPPPAKPSRGFDAAAAVVPPARAVAAAGVAGADIHAVSLRPIGGEPWYQFIVRDGSVPRYVHAATGAAGEGMDELYASEIASGHLGGAAVRKAARLTAFDDEYISIFRILPVYRFDADDGRGTRVYVSTMTGSVTRATDDRKQWEAGLFSNLHKFMFIKNKDLRDLALVGATSGVLLAGVSGILLFFVTRPRKGSNGSAG